MRILVSNDDGVHAEGIRALSDALRACGEVTVVAPDRNRSGASHSLTLEVPLRVSRISENGYYAVKGTPTDCVHLAVNELVRPEPDMVVAGINHGANLGDDVIYSGTVAAATEGYLLGLPSIAVSLCSKTGEHFETAARVALELVQRLQQQMVNESERFSPLLNVNVPDLPYEQLQGKIVTRLGKRHKAEPMISALTPRNETVYWIGAAGAAQDAGEGTDFYAVNHNQVSITPLQVDLTHTAQLPRIRRWLSQ